jgi:hypothetical protein
MSVGFPYNTYIGVDPGHTGAIAFYCPNTGKMRIEDMPILARKSGKKEMDAKALADLVGFFNLHALIRCAVYEDVGAMVYIDRFGTKRGQGAASSFAFGKSLGVVVGILNAFNIEARGVQPSVWKQLMKLSRNKDESREMAKTLFPKYADKFRRKKDDGRAEAALLAWFASERFK